MVSFVLWSGCSLQPLQQQPIGDLGYIAYRPSDTRINGVVVGVPHGIAEATAIDYATDISNETGAGLVIAYGFRSKRITVTQPLVRSVPLAPGADNPRRRGSIYPEFKALLRKTAKGPLKFYVGIRIADEKSDLDRIEVTSTGLTFEQLQALEESFARIRKREIEDTKVPVVELVIDSLDKISWRASGVKHHGVLMLAERGLDLRLPASLSSEPVKSVYKSILSRWISDSIDMIRNNPARLPQTEITVLEFGKIESVSGKQKTGIVIGAPHGTFDFFTAGTVREICSRTGLAGVIATGFTPTESGDGWRINVNRPSERHVTLSEREIETARARMVYEHFRNSVLKAAQGNLLLYVDIHQNSGNRIEVASVGFSKTDARFIKDAYRALRDRALAERPDVAIVDLAIEPLDQIEVGAWAAKTNGILTVANRSLHIELPSDGVMASSRQRAIYTSILTELIRKIAAQVLSVN